jgi:zinc protease
MDGASRVITVSAQIKDSSSKLPSEGDIRAIVDKVSTGNLAAYDDKISSKPLISQKPVQGKIIGETTVSDLGLTVWKLSNGARVILKPTDFKNDEILLSAISPGGTSVCTDADYISADVADNIVEQSGIGEFDQIALSKMLAGKNVSISPTISNLSEGFTGNTTAKDAETMFQLLYLYGTAPRKDAEAFQAFKTQELSFIKNRNNDPQTAFYDTLQLTMSQYHPRSKPFTVETVNAVDLDKAYNFYKDRFSDFSGFTFYLTGNVDLTKMRPLVETYIASLPSMNRKESWKDIGITPPKGQIKKSVFKGIEPKSSVMIALTGPFEYNAKNRLELQSMAEVLQIKLRETLREDMGGVYHVGVNAQPIHYPHERYQMSISFGCDPNRVDELIAETMKKLDTMTMKAPEEIYVTKVKEIAKHEQETNLKENRYWLSALSQLYFNGEDPHIITDRMNMISALNAEDIHRAAQKYCAKDNLVEVVLYPEKKKD